jgi:hypothetical protein
MDPKNNPILGYLLQFYMPGLTFHVGRCAGEVFFVLFFGLGGGGSVFWGGLGFQAMGAFVDLSSEAMRF